MHQTFDILAMIHLYRLISHRRFKRFILYILASMHFKIVVFQDSFGHIQQEKFENLRLNIAILQDQLLCQV